MDSHIIKLHYIYVKYDLSKLQNLKKSTLKGHYGVLEQSAAIYLA